MNKVIDVIQKLSSQTWTNSPVLKPIERYLVDHDDSALAAISLPRTPYWTNDLLQCLHAPDQWTDDDFRILRVIRQLNDTSALWYWLAERLPQEPVSSDYVGILRRALPDLSDVDFTLAVINHLYTMIVGNRTTSAGRYVLAQSDAHLHQVIEGASDISNAAMLLSVYLRFAPQRAPDLADAVLNTRVSVGSRVDTFKAMLGLGGEAYLDRVMKAFGSERDSWTQFFEAQVIHQFFPGRFDDQLYSAARAFLANKDNARSHTEAATWMMEHFGQRAIPDVLKRVSLALYPPVDAKIVSAAGKLLGIDALPIILAAVDHHAAETRLAVAEQLMTLQDPQHDTLIEKMLVRGFAETEIADAAAFISLAGRWKLQRMENSLWPLLEHKSKVIRDTVIRALSRLGDAAVQKSTMMLQHKKADVRLAAAQLLGLIGTDGATAVLESRVDLENNDDVRDQILRGLETAWDKQGRKVTREDIAVRIARVADKLQEPVAPELSEDRLPPLLWQNGDPLTKQEVRYLLYRQSRCKEMKPDTEARAVYRLINRKKSGPFAAAVLQAFLGTTQEAKDRWALAVTGLLGDDHVVPVLVAQIREWVDHNRGKLAEYAVETLALIGTDAALMAVDALAIRYCNKMKNVGKAAAEAFENAAENMGISPEELGDRVVPWIGFEPGKTRIIESGSNRFEVRIGLDLKLTYQDLEKKKTIKSLPKSVPAEILSELKDASANLREIIKAQNMRLENLMVRQRRWPVARWSELFLQHPVLLPYAVRLVWGYYDEAGRLQKTFRTLEDRSLTTNNDESFALPADGTIGIIHPLELTSDERTAWQTHLADYEIAPPFLQMEREVVSATPEQANLKLYEACDGQAINGMTFKGRAEKLGWHRGSVCDGGGISTYIKSFPAAGADVLLYLDGMYVGIDMETQITLGKAQFVKTDSVKIGSYLYDEPGYEGDSRVLSFGQVPPIVFSEAMGDLKKISGKQADASEDA